MACSVSHSISNIMPGVRIAVLEAAYYRREMYGLVINICINQETIILLENRNQNSMSVSEAILQKTDREGLQYFFKYLNISRV